jgi:hypothetical protein
MGPSIDKAGEVHHGDSVLGFSRLLVVLDLVDAFDGTFFAAVVSS